MLRISILLVSLPTFHILNFEMVLPGSFQDVKDPSSNDILRSLSLRIKRYCIKDTFPIGVICLLASLK
jgi:hypothetical protein